MISRRECPAQRTRRNISAPEPKVQSWMRSEPPKLNECLISGAAFRRLNDGHGRMAERAKLAESGRSGSGRENAVADIHFESLSAECPFAGFGGDNCSFSLFAKPVSDCDKARSVFSRNGLSYVSKPGSSR